MHLRKYINFFKYKYLDSIIGSNKLYFFVKKKVRKNKKIGLQKLKHRIKSTKLLRKRIRKYIKLLNKAIKLKIKNRKFRYKRLLKKKGKGKKIFKFNRRFKMFRNFVNKSKLMKKKTDFNIRSFKMNKYPSEHNYNVHLNQENILQKYFLKKYSSQTLNFVEECRALTEEQVQILVKCLALIERKKEHVDKFSKAKEEYIWFDLKSMCLENLETIPDNREFLAFAQKFLAAEINKYINSVYKNYKHLLFLPVGNFTFDENEDIDITFLNFIIFRIPNKDYLLTEENGHKKYEFVGYEKNFSGKILLLNKKTPYLLTRTEISEISYTANDVYKIYHEFTELLQTYTSIFELYSRNLNLIRLCTNKEDGRDFIFSFFKLYLIFLNIFKEEYILYDLVKESCIYYITEYLCLFNKDPYLASHFCKEFVDIVEKLKDQKGLLYDVLCNKESDLYIVIRKMVSEELNLDEKEMTEFYWTISLEYLHWKFTYTQYMLNKITDLNSKSDFEFNKEKMLLFLLGFRCQVARSIVGFMNVLFEEHEEIILENNTFDTFDTFKIKIENYFQSLKDYSKKNFDITINEFWIYSVDFRHKELIVQFYDLVKRVKIKNSVQNNIDLKFNTRLEVFVNDTSKLIKTYNELEAKLYNYINSQKDSDKDLFCETIIAEGSVLYRILVLMFELNFNIQNKNI
jgi:hypothetical protein